MPLIKILEATSILTQGDSNPKSNELIAWQLDFFPVKEKNETNEAVHVDEDSEEEPSQRIVDKTDTDAETLSESKADVLRETASATDEEHSVEKGDRYVESNKLEDEEDEEDSDEGVYSSLDAPTIPLSVPLIRPLESSLDLLPPSELVRPTSLIQSTNNSLLRPSGDGLLPADEPSLPVPQTGLSWWVIGSVIGGALTGILGLVSWALNGNDDKGKNEPSKGQPDTPDDREVKKLETITEESLVINSKVVALVEDGQYRLDLHDFDFSDENVNNELALIQIKSLPDKGELYFKGQAAIVGQQVRIDEIPTLSYLPAPDGFGKNYSSFSFTTNDGKSENETGKLSFNVLGVDDAPHSEDVSVGFSKKGTYSITQKSINYSDIEQDTMSHLRIDRLPEKGFLQVDGQRLEAAQLIAVSGEFGWPEIIYTPEGEQAADFLFSVANEVNGKQVMSVGPYTFTLSPIEIKEAPETRSKQMIFNEDEQFVFGLEDFAFIDANSHDSLHAVQIKNLPEQGALLFDGNAVSAGQSIFSEHIGKLIYKPEDNAFGENYTQFDFTVSDGLLFSEVETIAFTVNAIEDKPISKDVTIQVEAGSTYWLKQADLYFEDVDDGDSFQRIYIDKYPDDDQLIYSEWGKMLAVSSEHGLMSVLAYNGPAFGLSFTPSGDADAEVEFRVSSKAMNDYSPTLPSDISDTYHLYFDVVPALSGPAFYATEESTFLNDMYPVQSLIG